MSLIITFFFALLVCWFISFPTVWLLKVFRVGQNIRQEGPISHLIKSGTPTMGGISIILTILIFIVVLINIDIAIRYLALILLFLSYAGIGFADDVLKIRKRQNLGLTARQKFILQIVFASIFLIVLIYEGHNTSVSGALKYLHFDSPWMYFPLALFVIVGGANAVNLTDGLDGLAASTLFIAFSAFAFIAYQMQLADPSIIAATAAGAALAFLWFNVYPAEVFMGDMGSMSLGVLLSGLAVILHKELVFAVIGGVFVLEALSVIIQVGSYRMFRKKIFMMSPLHHHFELMGIPEPLVVLLFVVAALIFASLGIWVSVYI